MPNTTPARQCLPYLGWLGVNVAMAFALVDSFGVVGLALASTVAFTLLSAVLFWLNKLEGKPLAIVAGRALLGTAVLSLLILGLRQLISFYPSLFANCWHGWCQRATSP